MTSFVVTDDYYGDHSKSVRLSNMWILYCGITSGQCKTLRHYLATYGKPDISEPNSPHENQTPVTFPNYIHDGTGVLSSSTIIH